VNKYNPPETWEKEKTWIIATGVSWMFFGMAVVAYSCVFCRDPGYSKSIEIGNFYEILDQAIKENRNLDYFCFFCRCLMSYSSSHCIICRKCVEGFDHHCAFVNNCIGYRNHGAFLAFLFTALFYLIAYMFTGGWMVYRRIQICDLQGHDDWEICKFEATMITLPTCGLFLIICII